MTGVDTICSAIDANLMRIKQGEVTPRDGLEAAMATAVAAPDVEDARMFRRQAEVAFGFSAQLRRDGEPAGADHFEALAIGLLVQSARAGDATALQCLRIAGGHLCSLADQALDQGGDTILSAAFPAGHA